MRYPVLVLRRRDLVEGGACEEWLSEFDAICALRGDDRAPIMRRRNGSTYRDPSRLRIEITPLAHVWAARDARGAVEWLRARGRWPSADLYGEDLRGVHLSIASLRNADLRDADLPGLGHRVEHLHKAVPVGFTPEAAGVPETIDLVVVVVFSLKILAAGFDRRIGNAVPMLDGRGAVFDVVEMSRRVYGRRHGSAG